MNVKKLTHIDSAIVAFLDILGFRSLVRTHGNREEIVEQLNDAMKRSLEWFGGMESFRGTPDAEWKVRTFSDCLSVAKPATDLGIIMTLDALSDFIREMISSGFPIRGGIAIGSYSESKFMLFSQAQIEAFDLESKKASNPRVLVSQDLRDRINAIEDDELRQSIKEYLIVDEDSKLFLNYLLFQEEDHWQSGHRFYLNQKQILEKALKDIDISSSTRSKYVWMARLHNWSLYYTAAILKRSGILSEDDVWSFSSLLVKGVPYKARFTSFLRSDQSFQQVDEIDQDKIDWIKQWPDITTENDEKEEDLEQDFHAI
jgi:hypothetical protein